MTDIKKQVQEFIQDNFIMGSKSVQLADHDSFMERHLIDSTGFLELITYLEETFGIVVEDLEMVAENLDSLTAVEAFVGRKLLHPIGSGSASTPGHGVRTLKIDAEMNRICDEPVPPR